MIPVIDAGASSHLRDDLVRLRPWHPSDAEALVAAWHDPEIMTRLPVPADPDLDRATRWIGGWEARREAGVALDLVVDRRSGADADDEVCGEVCGEVGLSGIDPSRRAALIGWWLAEPYRGHGLASRAVSLMSRWVLRAGGLETLVAEIDADNRSSLRLAGRCGFAPLVPPPGGASARSDRAGSDRGGRQMWIATAATLTRPEINLPRNPQAEVSGAGGAS